MSGSILIAVITLVAIIVGSIIGVAGTLIATKADNRLQRRLHIWKTRDVYLNNVIEEAGHICETLIGYRVFDWDKEKLQNSIVKLRENYSRLLLHNEVVQPARDFLNRAEIIFSKNKMYDNQEKEKESKSELKRYYDELVKACEKILKS